MSERRAPYLFHTAKGQFKGATGSVGARPPIAERDFARTVLDLARVCGWQHYHTWISVRSVKGFPDLVLLKPPRLIFAELKSEHGHTTAEQERWLALLRACSGVEAYLWRPSDWDVIAATLTANTSATAVQ